MAAEPAVIIENIRKAVHEDLTAFKGFVRKNWKPIVAWFELLGGSVGLAFMLLSAMATSDHFLPLAVYVVPLALSLVSIEAGWLLLNSSAFGLPLSAIVQAAQILRLSTSAFAYTFTVGPAFGIYWIPNSFHWAYGLSVEYFFTLNPTDGRRGFELNFIAAIVFWLCVVGIRQKRQLQNPMDTAPVEEMALEP